MIQIDKYLWRGRQPRLSDAHRLKEIGIKCILNLREEDAHLSRELSSQWGMDYKWIPLVDNYIPSDNQVESFLNTIQRDGPTLVHCKAGEGRTGLFVAIYRMYFMGMRWEEALKLQFL